MESNNKKTIVIRACDIENLKDWITPIVKKTTHTCDFGTERGYKTCNKPATHRLQWGFTYSYLCEEHAPAKSGAVRTPIVESDVVVNAKFKIKNGPTFIVDSIEPANDKYPVCVRSSIIAPFIGAKGNYRDSITDFVAGLNEDEAEKVI